MQKKFLELLNHDFDGANWNKHEDEYTQLFYEQNLSQFWRPEDISLQQDLKSWDLFPNEVKLAYSRNLLILTFLDTYQGDIGMPVVSRSFDDKFHQRKAVLNFMAAMENAIHAKSYSNIFMTLLPGEEINELFAWGEQNKNLQNIINLIVSCYKQLDHFTHTRNYNPSEVNFTDEEFKEAQWKAMTASVFLESWLFYSGFYYPLYFYGQGKMMQSGEIINLIIRDESIHGVYVGRLNQDIYETFNEAKQKELKEWMLVLLDKLYREQLELTHEIYDSVEIASDVIAFVRYNANKALMNLGFDPVYAKEELNPIVINGLNTETKTHDFFSMKGTGYQKMKTEALKDSDFFFDQPKRGNI